MQHHDKSTNQIEHRDCKIFRAVMSKLGNFKKISCCTGHDFSSAVLIVKTERKFFQMIKNIPSHILLNAGPKNVAPVSNKPVTSFMNAKAHKKQGNKNQKCFQLKIRNQRVQCITRKHREGNINCSHKNSTRHVSGKELPVRLVVGEENLKRAF